MGGLAPYVSVKLWSEFYKNWVEYDCTDAHTIAHAEATKNNLRAYSQCECWRKTELMGG